MHGQVQGYSNKERLLYDPVEQWHLQQKHIEVVAYFSYSREDRGRHYYSHDSRRKGPYIWRNNT
jgi:hypothetical protein